MGGTAEETEEATELLELDVGEVSLVDRGAIRRKFSVIKALDGAEDDMGSRKTTAKADETKPTDKAADLFDVEVTKAATPMLTALAKERIALVTEKLDALAAGLGTMEKKDARDALYAVSDLVWSAERDVIAVSKALGVEPKVKTEEVETEKAHPRKMTARRRAALAEAVEKLQTLAKEFESGEDEDTTDEEDEDMGTPKDTKKEEGAPAAGTPAAGATDAIVTAVTKAVTDATAPILARLDALEKPVAKTEEKPAEKSEEDPATPTWVRELKKSLGGLGQRLDALEATSNAGGGNRTDTETKETKKEEGSVFKGLL